MQPSLRQCLRATAAAALLIASVCTLGACSSSGSEDRAHSTEPEEIALRRVAEVARSAGATRHSGMADSRVEVARIVANVSHPPDEGMHTAPDTSERKLIRNADLTIRVESVDVAIQQALVLADTLGGYTVSQEQSTDRIGNVHGRVQMRVPADRLDEMLGTVPLIGEVISKHVWSRDVTDQYYDVDVRLRNTRQERDQLSALLGRADRLEDILRVRRELSRVTSEYENLTGRMQRLSNQIRYSTVNVSLVESLPASRDSDTVIGKLAEAFRDMVDIFWSTLAGLIRFTGAAVPVVVIFAIALWIVVRFIRWRQRR